MKKEIKILILSLLVLLIILLSLVIPNLKYDCYDEQNIIFNYQFVQSSGKGLWMGVEHTKCDLMYCGHIDKCYRENYTYYFANDIKEFPNLSKGDKLITRWCYISKIDDYRIRGIKLNG